MRPAAVAERLSTELIVLPPLRDRPDEMAFLVHDAVRGAEPALQIHSTLIEACLLRPWPGNSRELVAEVSRTAHTVAAQGKNNIRGEDSTTTPVTSWSARRRSTPRSSRPPWASSARSDRRRAPAVVANSGTRSRRIRALIARLGFEWPVRLCLAGSTMNIQRFSSSLLLAAAVLATGCKKKESAAPSTGSAGSGSAAPTVVVGSGGSAADNAGSAGSAAPAAGSAAPAPGSATSKNPPPKIGAGGAASSSALAAIKLPLPKNGPATAVWRDVSNGEGDRRSLLEDNKGKDLLLTVRFIDCRLSFLTDYVSKPADQRGELGYCFDAPTGAVKGFDLIAPADSVQHAVRAGNIVVVAMHGADGEKRVKADELDAYLELLDLDAISKM